MIEYNKRNIRTWSMLGSRRLFGTVLEELAEQDDKFVFVTADVSRYYAINRFEQKYPERIINVGIAEQNMLGVAAGLAKEGYHPMVATYATFATARILDQIRVNMGLMQLGIVIVGVSAGLAEGDMSATHMGLEDIADVMPIPNINVISPSDCTESVKAMLAAMKSGKPTYIRLTGAANCPIVYKDDYSFEIGKSYILKEGKDVAILSTGTMVATTLKVADKLESRGISALVVNVATLRPIDRNMLNMVSQYSKVVTVEEHSIYGGLGSIVAQILISLEKRPQQLIIGTDRYADAAEYGTLLEEYGLAEDAIMNRILNFVHK